MTGRWRTIVIIVLVLVVGGIIGMSLTGRPLIFQPTPTGPAGVRAGRLGLVLHGQVQGASRHVLQAPAAGTVVALQASEGLPVTAGQTVLQLDAPDLRRQLAEAQQDVARLQTRKPEATAEARQQLQRLEQEVVTARGMVEQAKLDLTNYVNQHQEAATLQETVQRARQGIKTAVAAEQQAQQAMNEAQQRLTETGIPPDNFTQLQTTLEEKRAQRREANQRLQDAMAARLRLREELTRLEVLRARANKALKVQQQAEARLAAFRRSPEGAVLTEGQDLLQTARERLAKLEQQREALTVTAPAGGLLAELQVKPGATVQAGQALGAIEQSGDARLVFSASAADAQRLTPGARARVSTPGGVPFPATVTEIIPKQDGARVILQPRHPQAAPPPGTALLASL